MRRAAVALALLLAAPLAAGDTPPMARLDAGGLRQLLETHQGNVVVLNLWATWCSPCLKEIPELMALEAELGASGVVLVAVSMDDPADLARVEAFRDSHFPGFRSWLRATADMDVMVSVVDPAWNELLPTTYLIGRDGRVAGRVQGRRSPEELRSAVLALD